MIRTSITLAAVAWGLATAPAGAQLFRCTLPDGRTVYQDSRCDEDAKSKVLKSPAASAAPAPGAACAVDYLPPHETDPATGLESASRRKARVEIEMAVDVLTNYQGCSTDVPGFAVRFAGAYDEWRRRNRDALARFDGNPAAQRAVDCRLRFERQRARQDTPQGAQYKADMCMKVVGPAIEKIAREAVPSQ